MSERRIVRAPRGNEKSCKGWHQEAALRMLMNNLDPDVAEKHFGGTLAGKLIVSGGMGGMGGAQPLAATMNGARFLGIDVDPARIEKRLKSGYCDKSARSLDEALQLLDEAKKSGEAISV